MKISGKNLLDIIEDRLDFLCRDQRDSDVLDAIYKLTPEELNQIVSFGDVTQWRNERITRENEP